jgi:hypothetical protein
MAKKPAPPKAGGKADPKAGGKAGVKKAASPPGGGVNKMVIIALIVAAIPFSLPTVIVLGAGMLPTLGAFLSEKGENRYAFLCVGGLNFAAVVPYLFGMWFGVHNIDEALNLVTNSSFLLWSYLASMGGWVVYKAMPPIISGWLSMNTHKRINGLKAAQRKLIDDWGPDVVGQLTSHKAAPK